MRLISLSILFFVCFVNSLMAVPPKASDGWVFRDDVRQETDEFLPGTSLLTWKHDYSTILNAGVDRFLLKQTQKTRDERIKRWTHPFTTRQDYESFLVPKREKLAQMLGLIEPRAARTLLFADQKLNVPPGQKYSARNVCWFVFDDYVAEGVCITPTDKKPTHLVVAVPHCGMEPLAYFKSVPHLTNLANSGQCTIIVPAIVGRQPRRLTNRPVDYPAREALFQSAWEVGRHVIGYEVETIRALIDSWQLGLDESGKTQSRITLGGYGDGAMIALYTAVFDT
ncbi:MAG: hypothetical protein PHQ75_02720, partial [Thermoguttaceae bacterium]|nr:hypothetical protein [Thermoguttaceae bacterium]